MSWLTGPMRKTAGRNRGLYPEGRAYSPPVKAGGGSPPIGRARALSEGDCDSCGSRWPMRQSSQCCCHHPCSLFCVGVAKCHLTQSPSACANLALYPLGHNPHAHILLTVRPLDEYRKWQYKTGKEYRCAKGGEERGFTASQKDIAAMEQSLKQLEEQEVVCRLQKVYRDRHSCMMMERSK